MSDLVVHQLAGAWGLPSISPFCLKLDLYLRMVGIPYRTVVDATTFRGPKGKLAWIEHDGRACHRGRCERIGQQYFAEPG